MRDHSQEQNARALMNLLDRPAPEGYLQEWHERVKRAPDEERRTLRPLLVFRIGPEWLALAVSAIAEITPDSPVHRVPHRTNEVLRGIVNVRGELHLAVSLRSLLGVEHGEAASKSTGRIYTRHIVMQREGERFVARVDEVIGVIPFEADAMEAIPVNVSKALATYSRGLYVWRDEKVAVLDDELIYHSISSKYL